MNDAAGWVSAILVGGMVLISVALWGYVIRRQCTGQPHFFSARQRLMLPLGLVDMLLAFVMWMTGQMVGLAITFAVLGVEELDPLSISTQQQAVLGYAVGVCTLVTTILTLVYLYARYQTAKVFGGSLTGLADDLRLGMLVFFCFVPVTLLVQAALTQIWEYEHPTLDLISPDSSMLTMLSAWWMAVLVAPVAEEFFFRGILQGWLSRLFVNNVRPEAALIGGWPGQGPNSTSSRETHAGEPYSAPTEAVQPGQFNPYAPPENQPHETGTKVESPFYVARSWAPVFISAVLFGLVHLGQGPAPIPIFVFGLGLGMIYRQTGRIAPCIVAHFCLNAFSMAAYTVEQLYFRADAVEASPVVAPALAWSWSIGF